MSNKIRLRRFCLLLSYSGKNYLGMQRNPGTKTVEECLLSALKGTNLITEEQYVRPQLMYFQRAARTDKSVSAIKQIVSLKIPESITSRIDEINNLLPEDIRLMGCKRVTQSFDAKNHCDARTYSYLMPSLALCPLSEITKEDYRISDEVIDLFNSTLQGYVGTHNFHNFTSGKTFKDHSSVRIIRFVNCSGSFFPCDQKELEFVVVRIKGQSFMMHQIRKMIGLAIAVVKGFATPEHINRSMEEPYMDIPKAPGLGLMLEEVHFDRYNRKFGGDGHHEPIEWEDQNGKIEEFKNKYIYPVVVETELKEKSMMNWLNTLTLHSYSSDGKISYPIKMFPAKSKKGKDLVDKLNEEDSGEEREDLQDKKRVKLEEGETESNNHVQEPEPSLVTNK